MNKMKRVKPLGRPSPKKTPPENPKEEVWTKGKVNHMPRNVGNNELELHKLHKRSARFANRKIGPSESRVLSQKTVSESGSDNLLEKRSKHPKNLW